MTSRNAADTIEHHLLLAILRGAYPPGSRIPSVRAMSEQLGVNQATVQRALARLEATGLVVAKAGRGSVVQDPARYGDVTLIPAWLEALEDPDEAAAVLREFLVLRRTLTARLVASSRAALSAALPLISARAMDLFAAARSLEALRDADFEVSHTILAVTGNRAARAILVTAERVVRAVPDVAAALYAEPDANLAGLAAIVELLREDPGEAVVAAGVEVILAGLDEAAVRRFADARRGARGHA